MSGVGDNGGEVDGGPVGSWFGEGKYTWLGLYW